MGMGLIYGLILLILLLVGSISFLIYAVKRKSKTGTVIACLLTLLLLSFLFTNTIDEYSMTKKDVIADLKHIQIQLNDDFRIIDNYVSGMPERIQETVILVSTADKNNMISKIKNAANFTIFTSDEDIESLSSRMNITYNIKYPKFYSREIYTRIENYPTRIFLSVDENSDTISYQRIED